MASSLRSLSLLPFPHPSSSPSPRRNSAGPPRRNHHLQRRSSVLRSMVQSQTVYQGSQANYAKEMERLSAKESLLLAFRDAGGFESLVRGNTTEMMKIDVNERIIGLERLNPTPRPSTSPFLEGRWNFEWFGAGSPGLFAAKFLSERSPATLANILAMEMLIKDGYTKASAKLKLLSLIEIMFTLTTKLTVEGPIRMKEEYVEGFFETPTVSEQAIPEQLKGLLGQATSAMQQLPAPIKEAVSSGLTLPLNGTFQRVFMISYLDEEIMIIRDTSGAPDVLTRLEGPPPSLDEDTVPAEYET